MAATYRWTTHLVMASTEESGTLFTSALDMLFPCMQMHMKVYVYESLRVCRSICIGRIDSEVEVEIYIYVHRSMNKYVCMHRCRCTCINIRLLRRTPHEYECLRTLICISIYAYVHVDIYLW